MTTIHQNGALASAVISAAVALRLVWRPFALVILGGAAFVFSYYTFPRFAHACQGIAQAKARFGYTFSVFGGVLAGVAVPELAKLLLVPTHRIRPTTLCCNSVYFAFMGFLGDALYRTLGVVIGQEATVRNVVLKTAIDQFVFTPTLGVGIAACFFPLCATGFNWRLVFNGFGTTAWYVNRVLPVLVSAWCYWIPMTALIYSLPALLQIFLWLNATAAWSLLMIAVTQRTAAGLMESSQS